LRPDDGSRMSREAHVRFCESPEVRFLRATHPCIWTKYDGLVYVNEVIDCADRSVVGHCISKNDPRTRSGLGP